MFRFSSLRFYRSKKSNKLNNEILVRCVACINAEASQKDSYSTIFENSGDSDSTVLLKEIELC